MGQRNSHRDLYNKRQLRGVERVYVDYRRHWREYHGLLYWRCNMDLCDKYLDNRLLGCGVEWNALGRRRLGHKYHHSQHGWNQLDGVRYITLHRRLYLCYMERRFVDCDRIWELPCSDERGRHHLGSFYQRKRACGDKGEWRRSAHCSAGCWAQ